MPHRRKHHFSLNLFVKVQGLCNTTWYRGFTRVDLIQCFVSFTSYNHCLILKLLLTKRVQKSILSCFKLQCNNPHDRCVHGPILTLTMHVFAMSSTFTCIWCDFLLLLLGLKHLKTGRRKPQLHVLAQLQNVYSYLYMYIYF